MDKTRKGLFANFEEHYKFFLNGWNSKLYISPKIYSENGDQLSLIDKIIEQIDGPSNSPIVILGDSGMGKTSLGLHLCNIFWQRIQIAVQQNLLQNSHRMPIYTTYPKVSDNQRSFLSEIFEPEEKILDKKNSLKAQSLLIVIDAFKVTNQEGVDGDSGNFFQNLHLPWNEFLDIKFVVLCRNDSVPENSSALNNLFQLINREQTASPIQCSLQLLQPFENSQIKLYIEKFREVLKETPASSLSDSISHDFSNISMTKLVTQGTDWEETSDKFINCFSAHLDLYELAKVPFILHHILLVLPHVMEKTENESTDDITKFCLAKTAIIETFIQHWFKFQAQRLLKVSQDPFEMNEDLTIDELTCFFEVYAQHLAHKCIKDNILQDHLIKTKITEDWRLAEPNLIADKRMLELYKRIFKCENDQDPKMKNLRILREACPLQKLENGFRFSHFTFALYFASQEVFNGVEEIYQAVVENKDTEQRLNATGWSPVSIVTQIVDENIINALADRAKCDDLLEKRLWNFIMLSKTLSLIKVVASNAITILCRANYSFSKKDLRNVQIPKARLDGGLFGGADFRGADLTQVSFHHAWLPSVKLSGAKLSRVNFGETPSIMFDRTDKGEDMISDVTSIVCYSHSENEYWLVCFGMKLIEVSIETLKTTREIVCWDEDGQTLWNLEGMHSALFGDSHVFIWTDVGCEVKIWDYKTESRSASTPRKIIDLKDVFHVDKTIPSQPLSLELQCHYPYIGVLYQYQLAIYKIEGDCEELQSLHSVQVSFFPNLCDISATRYRFCSFSIHQNLLVFTGNESLSLILNFHNPDESKVCKKVFPKEVAYFRNTIFSPSGNFLAFSSDETIWIICKPSQVKANDFEINEQQLTGHQFQVSCITFWEDNSSTKVASCCTEKVIIWNFLNKTFQQHTMISTVCPGGALMEFNSDGKFLGFAKKRGNGLEIWDTECTRFTTSRVPDEIFSTGRMPEVNILRILPDSDLVVLALTSNYEQNNTKSGQDWLQIHDRNSGLKKSEIKCEVGLIYSLECLHKIRENSDVNILVLGQTGRTRIYLALCNTERVITKLLLTYTSDLLRAAVINCNPFIIASGIGKNLMVWRFSTFSSCNEEQIKRAHQYTFPHQENLFVECDSVALDTNGKYAAASSNAKSIYVFNLENQAESWFHEHDVEIRVRCIRFQDKNWNKNENHLIFAAATPTFVLIFGISTLDNKCVLLKELKDDLLTFKEICFVGKKHIILKGLDSAIVIITEEQKKETNARTVGTIEGVDYKIGHLKMFINQMKCHFICKDGIVEMFFCGIRPSTLSHLEIDLKQNKSRLLCSQSQSKMLEAIRCTIEESIDLTPANNLLLKSLGAIGNPRDLSSKPWGFRTYHPLADLFQEIPGTSDNKYYSVIHTGKNPPQITNNCWVVAGVAKRRKFFGFRLPQWLENAGFRFLECHVFIIVEGIENNRRFIVKIDLVTENIRTETESITVGRIQINPWIKYEKFLQEAEYYEAQQFLTNREKGFDFVSNLHEESWQKINYSKIPFKKQFNCITWVQEKLQEHFPRDYNPQTEWYNLIYRPPSDVIRPRGNALQNFANVFINFPPEVIVIVLVTIIVAFVGVRLMSF